MRVEQVRTESATYSVYVQQYDSKKPFTVFLHGGPGFNTYGERQLLGPLFEKKLNVLWFDLVGCAESPAHSPDKVTWSAMIHDIVQVARKFTDQPINIIGHCLGAHLTHDLVREYRKFVRSVVWYAPAYRIPDIFKGVLTRALMEERLALSDLNQEERAALVRFNATQEENFGAAETMTVLQMAGKIRGFQELYWSDPQAMKRYEQFMTERPVNFDAFVRLQTEFFLRGPLPVPNYEGIPVLMLYSEDDGIAPWPLNGARLSEKIRHAKSQQVRGGSHWMHHQRPEECARLTAEFLAST